MALALVEPLSTTSELARSIVLGVVEQTAHQARWLDLVGEFDAREGYADDGAISMANWLAWKCGIDGRTARSHVRVARALRTLPKLRAAFGEGRVSYSKVRAVIRVATPESEAWFVGLALELTAAQLERMVGAVEKLNGPAPNPKARERTACGATRWVDGQGLVHYELVVAEEEDLVVQRALEVAADRSYRARRAEARAAREAGREEGGPGGVAGGASADGARDGESDAGPKKASAMQVALRGRKRMLDAFMWLLQHGMRNGAGSNEPLPSPVLVVLPVEQRSMVMREDGLVDIGGGYTLHPKTVQRLGCSAMVQLAMTGEGGDGGGGAVRWSDSLNLGRQSRLASASQRQVLAVRFPHCTFASCDVPAAWCDIHHIVPWEKGGLTDLDNLRPLCRFHHHLCHEGGWRLVLDSRGRLVAIAPDGHREYGGGDALGEVIGDGLRVDADALRRRNRRHGFEPHDGRGLAGAWGGERMNRFAADVTVDAMVRAMKAAGPPLRT